MGAPKGHTWSKGNRGRPHPTPITFAIIQKLNEVDETTGKERIHRLVNELIKQALGYTKTVMKGGKKVKVEVPSDLAAIREIIDRVQGKAPMGITISGDPNNPLKIDDLNKLELIAELRNRGLLVERVFDDKLDAKLIEYNPKEKKR